ncbi:MAG: hypothetical protein ABI614_06490 [Planctomycetota bacterium]
MRKRHIEILPPHRRPSTKPKAMLALARLTRRRQRTIMPKVTPVTAIPGMLKVAVVITILLI